MSPALNGSSTLERFERSNAREIRNEIMFDFYPGLPHMGIFEVRNNNYHFDSNILHRFIWGDRLLQRKKKDCWFSVLHTAFGWNGWTRGQLLQAKNWVLHCHRPRRAWSVAGIIHMREKSSCLTEVGVTAEYESFWIPEILWELSTYKQLIVVWFFSSAYSWVTEMGDTIPKLSIPILIAERLSVRLIIVQARQALVGP